MIYKIRLITFILLIAPIHYFTQIVSEQWYEIHNENGLKVDVQLNISNQGCDNGMATLISHRYDGVLYSSEEFATWSVRYIGCDGKAYKYTHSTLLGGSDLISEMTLNPEDFLKEEFDDQILLKDILSDTFEEISKSSVKLGGHTPIQLDESIKPLAIKTNKIALKYGETTTISVDGGMLGKDAKWVWYKNSCDNSTDGTIVGVGESLVISPKSTTRYFVRAESPNHKTECIFKTISVDLSSTAADSISGKSKVCKGEKIELLVSGGMLGPGGANWVWYENGCGKSKKVGTGKSITLHPTQSTNIYVRAEGPGKLITSCVSKVIKVFNKTQSPKMINLFSDEICEGEKVEMNVLGNLQNGSDWEWLNAQTLDVLSTTNSLKVYPNSNTTYKVRAVSRICGNTSYLEKTIKVNSKSKTPSKILEKYDDKNNLVLYLKNGALGTDAVWKWYRKTIDKRGNENKLEVFEGQEYHPKIKNETYYVRAENGKCGNSDFVSTYVGEIKKIKDKKEKSEWLGNYSDTRGISHWGINFGIDGHQLYDTISLINNSTITEPHQMLGIGLSIGVALNPLINEYFTFGVRANASISLDNLSESEYSYSKDNLIMYEIYKYQKYDIGTNMLIGVAAYGKVKLLFDYEKTALNNDFELRKSQYYYSNVVSEHEFNKNLVLQTAKTGFRFGSYAHIESQEKMGNVFDLYFMFQERSNGGFLNFENFNLTNWNAGIGFNWWIHNRIIFNFNVTTNQQVNDLSFGSLNLSECFFNSKLLLTIDRFK